MNFKQRDEESPSRVSLSLSLFAACLFLSSLFLGRSLSFAVLFAGISDTPPAHPVARFHSLFLL